MKYLKFIRLQTWNTSLFITAEFFLPFFEKIFHDPLKKILMKRRNP